MEFTLIQTVTNITNVTTMVKQLSVFVHLDYFSVQIISIVIGQPMSFVLILAQVISQQLRTPQHQRHQQQHQQQHLQLQLRHQLQHLQHQHQLEVKLTRTFVKISRTVSILLQTVPSIISVSTMV